MAKGKAQTLTASARIAVLHGKDLFLQAEHTAQLKEQLAEAVGEIEVVRFDGATAAAADVLDECRSFGLLQHHKLVVVDNADQIVKDASRPLFERYAGAPVESATLLLRAERWNPGKLDKFIERCGAIVKCETPTLSKAVSWAIRRCQKRHGATISHAAAVLLVERLGADLGRIDSELSKLAVGTDSSGREISPDDVAELVGATREQDFWSIQAPLLTGDPEATLAHLRAILDNAPRDAHVPVTYACVDLARKLHAASRALAEGAHPGQITKTLRLWGPSAEPILRVAGSIDPAAAADLLCEAVEVDARQKSGRGSPVRNLEVLAIRFARLAGAPPDNAH